MKYTKRVESVGDASIVEHFVEGGYEEVLALFTELESKDAVEYTNLFYNPQDWVSDPVNPPKFK